MVHTYRDGVANRIKHDHQIDAAVAGLSMISPLNVSGLWGIVHRGGYEGGYQHTPSLSRT